MSATFRGEGSAGQLEVKSGGKARQLAQILEVV
jgi:hypothetical protein